MRPSPFILVALLLAGCSAGDQPDFHGLSPESYWVVTRTYAGDDRQCAPRMTTEPALLTFTAPDIVTLSTLVGAGDMFGPRGKVTADGALTFSTTFDTVYTGRFEDSEHFTLSGTLLRRFPDSQTCAVGVTAYRYPGPRVCEVTTEENEAGFATAARKAVAGSSLGTFKTFFTNLWSQPRQLVIYAIAETQAGEYAQTPTGWTMISPASNFRFNFDDGFVFERDAKFSHFSLTHPDGPALIGTQDQDSMRIVLDEDWVLDFGPEQMDFLWAPAYTSSLIAPVIPSYRLSGYSTPIGSFRSIDSIRHLNIDIPGLTFMARITTETTTLQNGSTTKTVTHSDRSALCPYPGLALFEAFPNLLEEMGYCTTSALYLGRVQCERIGP